MFQDLYTNPVAKSEEVKAERLIGMLYEEFMEHEDWLPAEYQRFIEQGEPKETVICDYIAGMTDNYAIDMAKKIFIPKSWSKDLESAVILSSISTPSIDISPKYFLHWVA